MIGKVWEVAILLIVVSIAAKVVLANLTPLIPTLLIALVLFSIGSSLYAKKRRF